ncbi:MAG: radical SAM protein [Alphaproteobacteria bacterium]|nr:radical SAM protein [Alphaproteobacteria bacterium]
MTGSAIRDALRSAKAFADPGQVGFLIVYVTNRCNFRCDFCFYSSEIDKGQKADEMTVDELARLARSTGPLLQLSLTGGEPFLRAELAGITDEFLTHTSARYLTIPTNGSLPDRTVAFLEHVLPRFPRTNVRVVISVEGIGEEHDRLRSMPGSFAKIGETYRALEPLRRRFANLVLDANSVYTARSETTLEATLLHLAREFDFDNLSITFARGEIRDPELKEASRETYIRLNQLLESLRRRKENRLLSPLWRGVRDASRRLLIRTVFDEEFVVACTAGRKLLVVGETGEVKPCEILSRSMGNLRDFDFDLRRLLDRPDNRGLVDWIVRSRCKCSFECALSANVVWRPGLYPRLAASAFRNMIRERQDDPSRTP